LIQVYMIITFGKWVLNEP